jgi:hypothetical protein
MDGLSVAGGGVDAAAAVVPAGVAGAGVIPEKPVTYHGALLDGEEVYEVNVISNGGETLYACWENDDPDDPDETPVIILRDGEQHLDWWDATHIYELLDRSKLLGLQEENFPDDDTIKVELWSGWYDGDEDEDTHKIAGAEFSLTVGGAAQPDSDNPPPAGEISVYASVSLVYF